MRSLLDTVRNFPLVRYQVLSDAVRYKVLIILSNGLMYIFGGARGGGAVSVKCVTRTRVRITYWEKTYVAAICMLYKH